MKLSGSSATAIAPDVATGARMRRWQALTLGLVVIGYAGYYLCRSNLSVALPMIIDDLARGGLDPAAARIRLGSIASLGVLAYAIGKFPSGILADFLGGRRNFLIGMSGAVVFTLWFAAGNSVALFGAAWIGNRFVQSLGWASAVKISSKWFSYRRYGTVMALVSLSFLFGDALARRFLAALIRINLSWREVFVVAAGVLAGILVLCLALLHDSPEQHGMTEPAASPSNLFGEQGKRPAPASLGSLLRPFLRSWTFWVVCALSMGTTLIREAFGLWTPAYFVEAVGFTTGEAAEKSALFPLLGGVSVLLCGWLSDRLGSAARAALVFAGLLLSGVMLLCLGLGPRSSTSAVVLVSLVAFCIIGPYSFLAGAISLDFGGKQGAATASGVIDGIGYLGGVLAGDTMARLSVAFGWNGFFIALAGIAFLTSTAGLVFWVREGKRKR